MISPTAHTWWLTGQVSPPRQGTAAPVLHVYLGFLTFNCCCPYLLRGVENCPSGASKSAWLELSSRRDGYNGADDGNGVGNGLIFLNLFQRTWPLG